MMSDDRLAPIKAILAKEYHERGNSNMKDVWKMVKQIPFFNQIVLKDEFLAEVDFLEMSKHLTHQLVEAGQFLCQ
jgi:hypothetical protein